jgi:hypothetical protein
MGGTGLEPVTPSFVATAPVTHWNKREAFSPDIRAVRIVTGWEHLKEAFRKRHCALARAGHPLRAITRRHPTSLERSLCCP